MVASIRHLDWGARLARHVDAHIGLPFAWGVRDCVTFALDTLDAVLITPIERPGFTYSDEAGAVAFQGMHDFHADLSAQLALTPVLPNYRNRSDLMLYEQGAFICGLVLVDYRRAVTVHREKGVCLVRVESLPLGTDAVTLWRLPA